MKYCKIFNSADLRIPLITLIYALIPAVLSISVSPLPAHGIKDPAAMVDIVGIEPHISGQVDLTLPFTSSDGRAGELSSFMIAGKPTIIVPVYYDCPRLCGLVTTGIFDALTQVSLKMGQDYTLLFASIDSREKPELAKKRKEARVALLSDKGIGGEQFSFIVGEAEPIRSLMTSLGFHYKPDGEKDFAHTAAIMILTPYGEIAHYFLGIEFDPGDLRLALVEASNGQVGTFVDRVLLYCFRFDPTKGKYTWAVFNVLKAGGAVTLLLLGSLMWVLWKNEKVKE